MATVLSLILTPPGFFRKTPRSNQGPPTGGGPCPLSRTECPHMWLTLHADRDGFTVQRAANAPTVMDAISGAADHPEIIPLFPSAVAVEITLGLDAALPAEELQGYLDRWNYTRDRTELIADAVATLGIWLTLAMNHPGALKPGSESGLPSRPTDLPS